MVVHNEDDVLSVAKWLVISHNKTWESETEIAQAAWRLEAWELLDLLFVMHFRRVELEVKDGKT